MYSYKDTANAVGFPIRTSADQRSFGSSPQLFAAFYVLRRLLSPRHPPYTPKQLLCLLCVTKTRAGFTQPTSLYHFEKNTAKAVNHEPVGSIIHRSRENMVEDRRLELLTPCVQGRCSPTELIPRTSRIPKNSTSNAKHWWA